MVGPALEEINPKLNPKTALEVDELLATDTGMYVCPPQFSLSMCIICIMCIMCIICTYTINADGLCRQKDGKTKYVKLLGKGILTLVDHLFWNLPFCSVKQSQVVRKKAASGVTEEEWSTKWEEFVAEHDLPGAREQLASGWKE